MDFEQLNLRKREKMKKILPLLFVFASFLSFQSCRETVPPETLEEDSEIPEQDSVDVDLGNYDDEP